MERDTPVTQASISSHSCCTFPTFKSSAAVDQRTDHAASVMSSSIDISEQKGVRFLPFGSEWVQGAMRIARPVNLELSYTREMMAGLLMREEKLWPRRILLIGLGA